MSRLNEIILLNNGLRSCIPIGRLKNLMVFDISFNELVGHRMGGEAEEAGRGSQLAVRRDTSIHLRIAKEELHILV